MFSTTYRPNNDDVYSTSYRPDIVRDPDIGFNPKYPNDVNDSDNRNNNGEPIEHPVCHPCLDDVSQYRRAFEKVIDKSVAQQKLIEVSFLWYVSWLKLAHTVLSLLTPF